MHLVQGIHEEGECLVFEDEEEDHRALFMALSTVNQGDRAMLHLCSAHSLSMNIVEFFYLESCLFGDGHALPLSEQEYRCLVLQVLSQLSTFLPIAIDNWLHEGRNLLQLLPDLLDHIDGSTLFLLGYFCRKLNEVEHLMEEALGGSNTGLPSDADVDGEVNFPGHGRALNVNDADGVDFLLLSHLVNDHDQILGLS